MTHSPLVSVIIPTYNSGTLLESAVASVEAQTFPNYEIIIIDDGSTDGTAEWVAAQPGRFRYCRQANQGQEAARKRGAELAKGELLAFLDADDMWLPHKLETQINAFIPAQNYSFIFSDGYRLNGATSFKALEYASLQLHRLSELYARPPSPLTIDYEFRMHCVSTSSLMVRKRDFDRVGGMPDLRQGEDFILCCLLLLENPALYLNEPLTYYRHHPGNTSAVGKGKQRSFDNIRRKDYARIYLSRLCTNLPHLPNVIKHYPGIFYPARLFLLLWWRLVYGSSRKKIFSDIIRYLKAW